MSFRLALIAVAVTATGFALSQVGVKPRVQIKPNLSKAAPFALPKNLRTTKLFVPSKSDALQKVAQASGQTPFDLPLTITLTPTTPMTPQATTIVNNAFMVVPGPTGNWVFEGKNGFLLCGANVPEGSKWALVTVSGSSDVHAESISLNSGNNNSTHQFGDEAGKDFTYSTVFDVQGKNSLGFQSVVGCGTGTVWVSNVSVQYMK